MIRQTRTYLVGAMSGATLIAIAIVAFVVLVSAQVFADWPLSALRGSGGEAGVSGAKAIDAAGGVAVLPASAATGAGASSGNGAPGGGRAGGEDAGGATVDAADVPSAPSGEDGGKAGGGGSGGGTGSTGEGAPGGGSGSASSAPSGSSPSSSSGDSTSSPPARTVAGAVNDTVAGVDETALGGTLGSTGVSGVTESAVNGVAGPESAVGKVVEGTAKAVGGLLGPNH